MSSRVQKQLDQTPGVIKYGVSTSPLRKHYYTWTVWADRASMTAFMSTEPHATAMTRLEAWATEDAAFTDWETRGSSAVDLDEAMRRLKALNQ